MVSAELHRGGKLDGVGGGQYLAALIGEVPTSGNAAQYLAVLRRCRESRRMIAVGESVIAAGYRNVADPGAVAHEFAASLEGIGDGGGGDRAISVVTAADLVERCGAVRWLWPNWLPCGYPTVLAGAPGSGKSAVALWLCACALTGTPWPDGSPGCDEGGDVLILDSEGAQAIWANRIREWGLPRERLLFPGVDGFGRVMLDDAQALAGVAALIRERNIRLIVLDSLRQALPAAVSDSDSQVGVLLSPWADLTRDFGIPLLLTHHLNKGMRKGTEATLDSLRGSGAIGAVARSVVVIDKPDPEQPASRLRCVKSNLSLLPEGLGSAVGSNGIDLSGSAPEAPRGETAVGRAVEFLRAALQQRPQGAAEVTRAAHDRGISKDSMYKARDCIGVVAVTDPGDPMHRRKLWSLPAKLDGM